MKSAVGINNFDLQLSKEKQSTLRKSQDICDSPMGRQMPTESAVADWLSHFDVRIAPPRIVEHDNDDI